MSAVYEYFRGMRHTKHSGHYVQKAQESALVLGIPDGVDTHAEKLTLQDIANARQASRRPEGLEGISMLEIAQGLFGDDWHNTLQRGREAEGAIDVSYFRTITGQLLVTLVQEAYNNPEFVGRQLFRIYPESPPWNLGAHIVPKISSVQQGPTQIPPGYYYPSSQMIQDYITLPAVGKFGEVLNLTLEAIGTDRTGQIGDSATKLGYRAKYSEEWQMLAVAAAITVTFDNTTFVGGTFNWLGNNYSPYQSSGANWINDQSGYPVQGMNYETYMALENLFGAILDPYSGIVVEMPLSEMQVLVPWQSELAHQNVLMASSVRIGNYPNQTSGDNVLTNAPNPQRFRYPILASKILTQLLTNSGLTNTQALNYFYLGAHKRALIYREMLPWTVMYAPPNNEAEFTQDIVQRIKTRRMGIPAWFDPRFAGRSHNN